MDPVILTDYLEYLPSEMEMTNRLSIKLIARLGFIHTNLVRLWCLGCFL